MGGKFKVPSHQFVHTEGTTSTCTAKWPETILVNFQKNCSLSEKLCSCQKSSCSFLDNHRLGNHQLYETKQERVLDSALGTGQPWIYVQTRGWGDGEQPHRKQSALSGFWQVGHEPVVCPGSDAPGCNRRSTDTGQVPLYCSAVWSLTSNTLCHFRHHNLRRMWNRVSKIGLWRWWVV